MHRLSTPLTKVWLMGGEPRRAIAASLARKYRTGVGVCAATCRLIAYVAPNGGIQELAPPHREVQRWDLANAPIVSECPCAGFYDPEIGGPWRLRGSEQHHPLCQYDRQVFQTFEMAARKSELPADLASRPDLWQKLRAHGQ